MEAREKVEKLMGVWESEIKNNQRAPSHWRKTLKAWAALGSAFTLFWIVTGIGAGVVERVWP